MNSKLVISLALSVASATASFAQSQPVLIAGFDFYQGSTNWFPTTVDFDIDGFGDGSIRSSATGLTEEWMPNLALVGPEVGTIFWNGQYGSTKFKYENFNYEQEEISTWTGTDQDNFALRGISAPWRQALFQNANPLQYNDQDPDSLNFNSSNGSFVVRTVTQFNNYQFDNFELSYAAIRGGANAATSISWEVSTDGVNYTSLGIVDNPPTNPSFAPGTWGVTVVPVMSLPPITSPYIYFRGTISGANGIDDLQSSFLLIDNIQVISYDNAVIPQVVIPEPSVIGGLLVGGLALLVIARRRR